MSSRRWKEKQVREPSWMEQALCARVGDPDDWHPTLETPQAVEQVRQICRTCPARIPCLEDVLTRRTPLTGVWAGTTTRDREHLLALVDAAQNTAA
ncbi:WhiB family transcriptional regulator [Nocardiopsis alba]|uniref:WhiB family transcriptional regulator n=1 Tax=Nocardiopsis alba TaxID=53437 RepID=UPI0033BA27FE